MGFAMLFVPALKVGIIDLGARYRDYMPQLVLGLITLVLLASVYIVIKQRELNEMRRLLISTYAEFPLGREAYARDSMTGALDRRALPDILELEAARANRYRAPFCLVLSDIRGFREINTQSGNLAGDLLIKEVGKTLQLVVRKTDVVVRYGPDEFLCLLPATGCEGGAHFTRRVAKALEGSAQLRSVALDFGIAAYQPGLDADAVLAEAERDMERKRAAT